MQISNVWPFFFQWVQANFNCVNAKIFGDSMVWNIWPLDLNDHSLCVQPRKMRPFQLCSHSFNPFTTEYIISMSLTLKLYGDPQVEAGHNKKWSLRRFLSLFSEAKERERKKEGNVIFEKVWRNFYWRGAKLLHLERPNPPLFMKPMRESQQWDSSKKIRGKGSKLVDCTCPLDLDQIWKQSSKDHLRSLSPSSIPRASLSQ